MLMMWYAVQTVGRYVLCYACVLIKYTQPITPSQANTIGFSAIANGNGSVDPHQHRLAHVLLGMLLEETILVCVCVCVDG